MEDSITCSAISNQYDSLLFGENKSKMDFNRLAIIEELRFGLSKGLYRYLPFNSITIKSFDLEQVYANFITSE